MIEKYLESKQLAWSPSTIKTVRAKLRQVGHLVHTQPELVYKELSNKYSPYTVKQYLIILGGYYESISNGRNPFTEFVKQNRRLFLSAYSRKKVSCDFSQALKLIDTISDTVVRDTCKFLLYSGLRISEAYKAKDDVVGKGGKRRKVYVKVPKSLAHPAKVRRALSKFNLSPHDLRKLCATNLVNKGATPQDLCEIFGWSNLQTAYRYLQPKTDDKIKEMMNG